MSIKQCLKQWWTSWNKKRGKAPEASTTLPLREFIYLDEVSLMSLLASQMGAVTDQVSVAISKAVNAELSGGITADAIVGKGEFNSKYETSNSQSTQTTRKAIKQSLFKEFREQQNTEVRVPLPQLSETFNSLDEVLSCKEPGVAIPSHRLKRGQLIEFEVELSADPVFKMSTVMSEFLDMEETSPEVFAAAGASQTLKDLSSVSKLLRHLLVGLIPIRATAIDYCVVRKGSDEFLVRKDAIAGMANVEQYPLQIVGVTEHLSYWKDIRRVLFSDAKFTMLCRLSRDGIQDSWTPVKMVDLIDIVAPDFREQMDILARFSFDTVPAVTTVEAKRIVLGQALRYYCESYLAKTGSSIEHSDKHILFELIECIQVTTDPGISSEQVRAFALLDEEITKRVSAPLDQDTAIELRSIARLQTGLEFPGVSTTSVAIPPSKKSLQDRLIDTEVIAIYW